MVSQKKGIAFAISFTILFLAGGFLHILLYGVDFADAFCQLYYGFLTLIWGITLSLRITDRRIRRLLLGVVFLLIACFLLQAVKYRFAETGSVLYRYVGYLYYISFILIPLLMLYVAFSINLPEEKRIPRISGLFIIPCIIFIILFMTNDLHGLIFHYKDESMSSYSHGILFYISYAMNIVYFTAAILIFFRKCRLSSARSRLWLIVYFAAFEIVGFLGAFELGKINGIMVWAVIEVYAFVTIGLVESCIQIGLIPANTGYKDLFSMLPECVVISDTEGNVVFSTNGMREGNNVEKRKKVTADVSGGFCTHFVDTSEIDTLNRLLNETTLVIESRNECLKEENKAKEERSQVEARNRLYDNIALIVKNQIERISELTDCDNDTFVSNLPRINVYNVYIKRRSNMELLKEMSTKISLKELQTAILESCEYLKLLGFNPAISLQKEYDFDAKCVIIMYEFFEYVVEGILEKPCDLLVRIYMKEDRAFLRMLLGIDKICVDTNWNGSVLSSLGGEVKVTYDEDSSSVEICTRQEVKENDN